MSDESLQLAVNSIQYFLSCHHYLHSLSAPKAAPCPAVAEITPGENMRNPAVNKVRKQVFYSNQSRGLLMLADPYLVAVDVRSHKLKCHPFSLNPRMKKARQQWRDEIPLKLWFVGSCRRGSVQSLRVMLVPSPGVLRGGELLIEFFSAAYMTPVDSQKNALKVVQ